MCAVCGPPPSLRTLMQDPRRTAWLDPDHPRLRFAHSSNITPANVNRAYCPKQGVRSFRNERTSGLPVFLYPRRQ